MPRVIELIDTAVSPDAARRDFHDRAIWGSRENVKKKSTGDTIQLGNTTAPTMNTAATAAMRPRSERTDPATARATLALMNPVATVLATSDGDAVRMPYPSQAALEAVIINQVARLTPRE